MASAVDPSTRTRRAWLWWCLGGAVVVLALGIWFVTSWLSTYNQAEQMKTSATSLRTAISDRALDNLPALVASASADASALQSSTSGIPWRVLGMVPFLGANAGAVGDLADAVAPVLEAGAPLADVASSALDGGLRDETGAIDVTLIANAAPALSNLSAAMSRAESILGALDPGRLRPEIAEPLADIRQEIADAAPAVATAADVASRLPAMLGADGPRSWLLLLQNPAESRGSGGFPGAYVVLKADDGHLSVGASGTSAILNEGRIPLSAASDDAQQMWGDRLERWSTFSDGPHFPTTGALAQAGMKELGVDVDGVIAVDPATVAAILKVAGPVTVDGREFTADNVAKFFTVDVYREFPDPVVRDQVSMKIVTAALTAVLTQPLDLLDLADAMRGPVEEERVRAWSSVSGEEEWLETTPIGGSVSEEPGPNVTVAFSNSAANKMDAFVSTAVTYRPGTCPTTDKQTSTVDVTVRNDAPTDLPLETDNYSRHDNPDAPEGSTSLVPYIYAPPGAGYVSATIDGEPVELFGKLERNRPVWFAYLELDRGQEKTISVTFTEPTVSGIDPSITKSGMVNTTETQVLPDPACS